MCQYETFQPNCTTSASTTTSSILTTTNSSYNHHYHHYHRGHNKRPMSDVEASIAYVVFITNARYGRLHVGRCATSAYGNIGCHKDVTDHVAATCSGLVSCSLHVPDDWLKSLQPCPKDFSPFLLVQYMCVPGTSLFALNNQFKEDYCREHLIILLLTRFCIKCV